MTDGYTPPLRRFRDVESLDPQGRGYLCFWIPVAALPEGSHMIAVHWDMKKQERVVYIDGERWQD